MKHVNEGDLVLYYYAEPEGSVEVERHLTACAECREEYAKLQRVLATVESQPVPELPADYEDQVWQRVSKRLSFRERWAAYLQPRRWAMGAAFAAMLVAAFYAGMAWRPAQPEPSAKASSGVHERVMLIAVGDHLERSQLVLVELANSQAGDISFEQRTAEDLLGANRLYRQTAVSTGDDMTAELLDDLERTLMEIVHSPPQVSARQLEELRRGIQDRGILVKVKVFSSQLREQEEDEL